MKKYLLDTHTLLWLVENNPKLSKQSRRLLAQNNFQFYVSIITFWELTIKVNIGKLSTQISIEELYNKIFSSKIKILSLDYLHIKKYEGLELHHRDPFDRILIAQAQEENMTIITKDANFAKYDVQIIW